MTKMEPLPLFYSVSLSRSSHFQQVNISKRYGIEEVVLTRIGGQSNPLREAGVLQIYIGERKVKKILCYKLDERVEFFFF